MEGAFLLTAEMGPAGVSNWAYTLGVVQQSLPFTVQEGLESAGLGS